MSYPRFFLDTQIIALETEPVFVLELSPDDAKHARVLRLQAGERIAVVDAASDYFLCEVVESDREGIRVRIASKIDAPRDAVEIVLFQGLAKGDRFEDVLRHGSEVGVNEFVPLACARSVVRLDAEKAGKKSARWQSIVKSAAMQAGLERIPVVHAPRKVAACADIMGSLDALLVFWEETPLDATIAHACAGLSPREEAAVRVGVVIGPEGGLEDAEVSALLAMNPNAHAVSLGSRILRTETAGIVAPALVRYELERSCGTSGEAAGE